MNETFDRPALELLQELRTVSEHVRIEAKRGTSIGRSVMETVCAFANEPGLGGGWLLLGIDEPEELSLFPDFRVVGIANLDKLQNDLLSQCRNVFNVTVGPRIVPENVEGQILLKVFVPEASAASKPVYFKNDGLPHGAFRRISAGDVHCSDDDLLVLYEGRSTETYDGGVVANAEMNDIDPDAVEDYRRERKTANPVAEELNWSDEELLFSLGCIHKNQSGWQPTVAGILLFGSRLALRRLFPMMRVDYIRVPGKEWVPDPDERFDTIDILNPMMRAARRAQAAILDDLPEAFSLPEGEMQRETQRVIPNRVIREAVVNAVLHRTYRVQTPIQIIRYSNRLEIRNPGYSLKNEENLGEPGSEARNPKIAAVLHETRFAETKGSGIRVMRSKMQEAGLTPPLFESDRAANTFVATFLFHHFLGEDDLLWLASYKEWSLSDDEAKALIYVREQGAINNAAYRNLNITDTLNASTHLRRLRDCDLLEKKGKGTATYYIPGPKFLTLQSESTVPSKEPDRLSTELSTLSTELEVLSTEFGNLYIELKAILSELPLEVQRELLRNLPKDRQDMGQRSSRMVAHQIILRLCNLRSWRADELALLLQRSALYMRQRFLSPMVAQGLLERTYPGAITHPYQAYRAVQQDAIEK